MNPRASLSACASSILDRFTRACFDGIAELRVTKLEHGRLWVMVVRDQEEAPPPGWEEVMKQGRVEVVLRGREEDGIVPLPALLHFCLAPTDFVHSPRFFTCTLLPAHSPRGGGADYTVRRLAEFTSHRLVGEPIPEVAVMMFYLVGDEAIVTVKTS